jgi:hypothetical protein
MEKPSERDCDFCGEPFVPQPGPGRPASYCSNECRVLANRERCRKWREEHPDYHRQWLEAHPGYMERWREAHRDHARDYIRQWRRSREAA